MTEIEKLDNLLKAGDDLLKKFFKKAGDIKDEMEDEDQKDYEVKITREDVNEYPEEEVVYDEDENKYLMEDETEEEPDYEYEVEDMDDEEEDIDEEKFLKYLKKYANENKEKLEKLLKEAGILQKSFYQGYKKYQSMKDGVDGVIFDGSEILKSFKNYVDYSSKIIGNLYRDVQELKQIIAYSAALSQKNSKIISKSLKNVLKSPDGLYKAYQSTVDPKKLKDLSIDQVRDALIKAAVINNDDRASFELTKLESCNYDLSLMGEDSINYIKNLMRVGK